MGPDYVPSHIESISPSVSDAMGNIIASDVKKTESSSVASKALTVGAVASSGAFIAYEWGIGNEIVTPAVAGMAAEMADGLQGTALATAVSASLVFAEQFTSGAVTAYALGRAPRFTNWLNAKIANQTEDVEAEEEAAPTSWENLNLKDRFDYTMALGATFAAAREKSLLPESSTRDVVKQVYNSAKIATISVAIIAFSVDGTTRLAASTNEVNIGPVEIDTSNLADAADFARNVLYDWRFWGAVFGAKFAYRGIQAAIGRVRGKGDTAVATE
ncbi:MAG: hypothetical protein WAQ57_01655 [Candidatus Saccharimonadales bacterium]